MKIGSLREIKNKENRVGLTPEGAGTLNGQGHKVYIERGAGQKAGYSDEDYAKSGAILTSKEEVCKECDILVKVKEPQPEEYPLLELMKGKTIFTYFHLAAAEKSLTENLLKHRITSVAYETITDEKGHLPLLAPMSEIAGTMAIEYGGQYLQQKYGGLGITLSTITGTRPAEVVVVGGGTAGAKSAEVAAGMGANVTIFELSDKRIASLNEKYATCENIKVEKSKPENISRKVPEADLLIGAVLVPGNRAPTVITEDMIKTMKKGAVIVDIAIDQGGCIYGSRPTTHENPIYELDGKIFCCITNIPGQVPRQSTLALTSTTIRYLQVMANHGVIDFAKADKNFADGINTHNGLLTNEPVTDSLDMPYTPLEEALKDN